MEDRLRAFAPGTFDRRRVTGDLEALLARHPDPAARPPLFGVPAGVKDILHCEGFVTRCGTDLPPGLFQGPEAEAVRRLKAAGAVVMGKTATTEFAYFAPADTLNPRNLAHTPGGSSSGSAAGVAAGFFHLALGTQTVGSVIRPAAFCGVVGFKPSIGRIPTDGVVPFSPTADHVGVFCRDAAELPAALSALADRWRPAPAPSRIRLGVPAAPYLDQASAPALAAFRARLRHLENAGCEIVQTGALEDIAEINERHTRLITGEIARVHAPWFEEHRDRYRTVTRDIILAGMAVTDADLAPLGESGPRLRAVLGDAMERHGIDAWASPAATGEAPRGLGTTGSPLMNLPWTHAGLPAATLPAGSGPGGLPLGLQLAGGFMDDERLAALAAAVAPLLEAESGEAQGGAG
jgi:Asp-tRNA(Asn)/Glu-tRNA(Gln) amidotransferase A subunit family amidase